MNADRRLPVIHRLTVEQFKTIHRKRLLRAIAEKERRHARRQAVIDKLKRECGIRDRDGL